MHRLLCAASVFPEHAAAASAAAENWQWWRRRSALPGQPQLNSRNKTTSQTARIRIECGALRSAQEKTLLRGHARSAADTADNAHNLIGCAAFAAVAEEEVTVRFKLRAAHALHGARERKA